MDQTETSLWRETFFKEDGFNIDQCLTAFTQKSDLERLKVELKNYAIELHQQMADILKTETEAIVNLAEYLTNLNTKMEDLSVPIAQLREEIRSLYDLVQTTQSNYNTVLISLKNYNTTKKTLYLESELLLVCMYIKNVVKFDRTTDPIVLERVVNRYSFHSNYLKELQLMSTMSNVIKNIGSTLLQMVNDTFLMAVKHHNKDVLTRCLRMYDNLGKHNEAEKIIRIKIVRPALEGLFNETYLNSCNQDIGKIYTQAIRFIEEDMKVLLEITNSNFELKSLFNFVLNSFWPELDELLRDGLPNITAPGNPDLFQQRFTSTWTFLRIIANKCGNEALVRTNRTFQEHIKRFNLPVYFEIRFQQIAGQFESYFLTKPSMITGGKLLTTVYKYYYTTGTNEITSKLKITLQFWQSLLYCFKSDVFIDHLSDQFIKLSMLLLARYLQWFDMALTQVQSIIVDNLHAWETFVVDCLSDLNLIKQLIGRKSIDDNNTSNHIVYKILPMKISQTVIVKICQLNDQTIDECAGKLEANFIQLKCIASLDHLAHVKAIPRLYRRTNRAAPKQPSSYMIEAIQPIVKFYHNFKTVLLNQLVPILERIVINIAKEYLNLVREVLRSVCRTEESLRRLNPKNRNNQQTPNDENTNGQTLTSAAISTATSSDTTMTDEMKIREQIKLDVTYFVNELHQFTFKNGTVGQLMDQLKDECS